MTGTIHLDHESVDAVAARVVELLRADASHTEGLIDAAEVARRFGVSADWVYTNAKRLGAIKLGDGPKARLRFNPAKVFEALGARPDPVTKPERRPMRRHGKRTDLLPVKGVETQ